METSTPRWPHLVPVAGFALGCMVVAIALWVSFGGVLPLEPQGYRVTIPLPQAANLNPGADARMAGVTIGKVVKVERQGRSPDITVELDARFAPLRSEARAILRNKTLLGEAYLELASGPRSAKPVPDGGRLPARNVKRNQRLEDVLSALQPRTRKQLRQLLSGLGEAVSGRGEALNDSLGTAAPLTANMGQVTRLLDDQRADLQEIVSSSGDVMGALGERQDVLRAAIRSGDRVLDETSRRDRELQATIRALPPFLRELRGSSSRLAAANGDLAGAVKGLRATAPELMPTIREVESSAPQFRAVFNELPGVISAGNAGLPALRKIAREARPTLRQTYPAAREVIPVMRLLGEIRGSLITTLAHVGQIHNGTMVGPGGRVLRYANGIITIWNESIGGWVKRLPTNRGNTYPKPDFLKDISRGGLKSFDCRHVNNPLYLPPLLSSPPCRTQGPWTFDGKTAYYPRLRKAPP